MEAIVREAQSGILAKVCDVALVLSNNPDAAGLATAAAADVQTLCIPSAGRKRRAYDSELVAALELHHLDYIVLAGYMRIISAPLLNRYPGRIINIHPADTTQHQGLDGYRWAFENALPETRITVHVVDAGLDTGPIIAQTTVDLRSATTLSEVERLGLAAEHSFYSRTLRRLFTP